MIWPERVDVYLGADYGVVHYNVPAMVYPLGTDVTVDNGPGGIVSTRYRVILAPTIDIPAHIGNHIAIAWSVYQMIPGMATALYCDGTAERHENHGRLHHYELTTAAVTG